AVRLAAIECLLAADADNLARLEEALAAAALEEGNGNGKPTVAEAARNGQGSDGVPLPASPPSPVAPLPTASNGATLSTPKSAGRGKNGTFVKGNRCAAGRSHGRKTAELRMALLDAVGPKTLKRIARKLAKLAETGDLDAAKLLLAYTIGKPTEAAD